MRCCICGSDCDGTITIGKRQKGRLNGPLCRECFAQWSHFLFRCPDFHKLTPGGNEIQTIFEKWARHQRSLFLKET